MQKPSKLLNILSNYLDYCRKTTSYYRTYYQNKILLIENRSFKGKHNNKRCFVIGNGPSLKNQDISKLRDEITIVTNAFYRHPVIGSKWQPKYYCFADPNTFDGSKPLREFFKALNKKISSSVFFAPLYGKKTIESQKLLPESKVYYVLFAEPFGDPQKQIIELDKFMPFVQSTSQLAIELAIYMGCNPIYLLGMDHDWLSHRSYDKHFYSGKTVADHPVIQGDLSRCSYKDEMKSCLRLWEKYEFIKKYTDDRGIKIINVTSGGFLDVFKRAKFEDIINNHK